MLTYPSLIDLKRGLSKKDKYTILNQKTQCEVLILYLKHRYLRYKIVFDLSPPHSIFRWGDAPEDKKQETLKIVLYSFRAGWYIGGVTQTTPANTKAKQHEESD